LQCFPANCHFEVETDGVYLYLGASNGGGLQIMPSYEDLKSELLEISKILEKLPEQVRPQAYDLLVAEFLGRAPAEVPKNALKSAEKEIVTRDEKPHITKFKPDDSASARKRTRGRESYAIDRNLNLRGDKSIPSFKSFHDEKKPGSAMEFNAVAVYYLQKLLGMNEVTLDHAYTCYEEVSRKPPGAFRQSFIDTKNREGWLEFDDSGHISIPHRGIVFVQHDLPRLEKPSKN
jgi:hypothetical protein